MLYQILLASFIGGMLSLVGGLLLLWKEKFARRIVSHLISFAAGSLLGAALLDVLPEALEGGGEGVLVYVLAGILSVLFFEKILGWYHHHDHESHKNLFSAQSILFGDVLHNFIDGIAIALGFMISPQVGITTTFAVFVHEIPQEIGDFGVLISQNYPKRKIILYNLITATATIVGAILAYYFFPYLPPQIVFYGLAFVAGTFIYISTADLIPELRTQQLGDFGFFHTLIIVLGIVIMAILSGIIPE